MDAQALYQKIAQYCAFQERSMLEVTSKLKAWEVPEELQVTFMELLIEEGYLDQERFAKSYARGKVNIKKWGKAKVRMHLKQKGVADEVIQDSLGQIDPEHYFENAQKLVGQKLKSLKDQSNLLVVKQKIYRFLLSKGFEMEVIQKAVDKVLKERS